MSHRSTLPVYSRQNLWRVVGGGVEEEGEVGVPGPSPWELFGEEGMLPPYSPSALPPAAAAVPAEAEEDATAAAAATRDADTMALLLLGDSVLTNSLQAAQSCRGCITPLATSD